MWEISKNFSFCYGHRVWTQELIEGYATSTYAKCKHLHGHEGLVTVYLQGNETDKTGMVTDFRHLEWCKVFLDKYIDHKMILDTNDPMFSRLVRGDLNCDTNILTLYTGQELVLTPAYVNDTSLIAGYTFNSSPLLDQTDKQFYDGIFVVEFPPTSENLAKWMYEIVDERMSKIGVTTAKVQWNETPTTTAVYKRCNDHG